MYTLSNERQKLEFTFHRSPPDEMNFSLFENNYIPNGFVHEMNVYLFTLTSVIVFPYVLLGKSEANHSIDFNSIPYNEFLNCNNNATRLSGNCSLVEEEKRKRMKQFVIVFVVFNLMVAAIIASIVVASSYLHLCCDVESTPAESKSSSLVAMSHSSKSIPEEKISNKTQRAA